MTLVGHSGTVSSVVFHPDHRRVITAGDDKTVRFYTLDAEELAALVLEHLRQATGARDVDQALVRNLQAPLQKVELQTNAETTQLRASGSLEVAQRLARIGNLPLAQARFDDAKTLAGSLPFDSQQEAKRLGIKGERPLGVFHKKHASRIEVVHDLNLCFRSPVPTCDTKEAYPPAR